MIFQKCSCCQSIVWFLATHHIKHLILHTCSKSICKNKKHRKFQQCMRVVGFSSGPKALRLRNLAFKLDKTMPSSVLWRNPKIAESLQKIHVPSQLTVNVLKAYSSYAVSLEFSVYYCACRTIWNLFSSSSPLLILAS